MVTLIPLFLLHLVGISSVRENFTFSTIYLLCVDLHFSPWVFIHNHDYFDIHISDLDSESPSKLATMSFWQIPIIWGAVFHFPG